MKNFEIFKEEKSIIVVMKTCEPPFNYLQEIGSSLRSTNFKGAVIIDQLLHAGNTNERFIIGYFDGEQFQKDSFAFKYIDRRNPVRKYMCDFLRDDQETIELTILNNLQKRLISKGCYI